MNSFEQATVPVAEEDAAERVEARAEHSPKATTILNALSDMEVVEMIKKWGDIVYSPGQKEPEDTVLKPYIPADKRNYEI